MTINCKGKLIDLSTPHVMGILNITPDSFFDGGRYKDESTILNQVERMRNDGATFIDVGAYSTRPGAAHVDETTELSRILPVIELMLSKFPDTIISVDTFRSNVAKKTIAEGAAIINDISAGNLDPQMMSTVGQLNVPYILMHMQGTPQTMQNAPSYTDVVKEITKDLSTKISQARSHGINDVIADPGFGFGKTIAHNYQLLHHLDFFQHLQVPILAGVSRKSMIYKVLENTPQEALNGTTVLHTIALLKGAQILRVHDVKEAIEAVKLTSLL